MMRIMVVLPYKQLYIKWPTNKITGMTLMSSLKQATLLTLYMFSSTGEDINDSAAVDCY